MSLASAGENRRIDLVRIYIQRLLCSCHNQEYIFSSRDEWSLCHLGDVQLGQMLDGPLPDSFKQADCITISSVSVEFSSSSRGE
ncbi:unnamed protein product [Calypogeia fissa]